MRAKNEISETILLDYELYYELLDEISTYEEILYKLRKIALGWKAMNGAHSSYGDTMLRILDEKEFNS